MSCYYYSKPFTRKGCSRFTKFRDKLSIFGKKIRDKYGTELVEIWKKIGDSTSRDFDLSLINYTACSLLFWQLDITMFVLVFMFSVEPLDVSAG